MLLQSTDLAVLTNLAPVAKTLLERGGFKVDMQSMDWQTLVSRRAKKDAAGQGGWNIAMTATSAVLLLDPVNNHYAEASGDRAQFGWPLDEEIEKLRAAFVRESDPKKQFEIAEKVQARIIGQGVTVPLGQFLQPMARRKNVIGNMPPRSPCSGTSRRDSAHPRAVCQVRLDECERRNNETQPLNGCPASSRGKYHDQSVSARASRSAPFLTAGLSLAATGARPGQALQFRLRPAEHHGLRHRRQRVRRQAQGTEQGHDAASTSIPAPSSARSRRCCS